MEICKFDWKDIKQIINIENDAFDKDRWDEIEFMRYYESFPDGFLIAKENNRIMGYAIVEKEGYIRSIAVMKNERRKGIGKRIMEEIEKIVKENKGEELSLHVRASNKDAIGFYRSLGFQEIMIFEKVYNDGEDAIYMKKKID